MVGFIFSSFLVGDIFGDALERFLAVTYREKINLAALMIFVQGIGFYSFSEQLMAKAEQTLFDIGAALEAEIGFDPNPPLPKYLR